MKRKNKIIIAYGYVKEEKGVYSAICVNMGLFGQGKTREEAFRKVIKAIESYITYVLEEHPNECEKFFDRPAPANFIKEYKQGKKILEKLIESKQCQPKQPYRFIPERYFAEKVSFAQT